MRRRAPLLFIHERRLCCDGGGVLCVESPAAGGCVYIVPLAAATQTLLSLSHTNTRHQRPTGSKQSLVTIGDKGRSQLSRAAPERLTDAFQDTYKVRTTFPQAAMIAEAVLAQEPDAVKVLFNKFHSAISFKPTVRAAAAVVVVVQVVSGGVYSVWCGV